MWENHSENPERIRILPRSIQVQEQRSHSSTNIQNIICILRSNMILKGTEHHESWALEHLQIWEFLSLNNGTLISFLLFFFFYVSGECIFLFLAIRVKDLKHHFLQIIKHFISCSLLNGNIFLFCSVYIILKVLFYLSGFFTFSSPF